jgi:hypothetical protein
MKRASQPLWAAIAPASACAAKSNDPRGRSPRTARCHPPGRKTPVMSSGASYERFACGAEQEFRGRRHSSARSGFSKAPGAAGQRGCCVQRARSAALGVAVITTGSPRSSAPHPAYQNADAGEYRKRFVSAWRYP